MKNDKLSINKEEVNKIRRLAENYTLVAGKLYKMGRVVSGEMLGQK